MSKNKIQTIVVLGMHRSGTSMLGSMLHNMGVTMGSKEDIERSEYDNVLGFYENYDIAVFNDKLLNILGGRWDEIPSKKISKLPKQKINYLKSTAEKILQKTYKGANLIGIKEPRVTILLDFWGNLLKNPKYILIFRNPLDAAKSVNKRDKITVDKALETWAKYNKSAVNYLHDKKYLIVKYEDILQDPISACLEILNYLGIKYKQEDLPKFISNVEPGIQHHQTQDEEFFKNKTISKDVKEMYKKLIELYKKQSSNQGKNKKVKEINWESHSKYIQERIKKIDKLTNKYREEAVFLNSKNEELVKAIDKQKDIIADLKKRLESLENQLKRIRGSRSYKIYKRLRPILIKLKLAE